MSAMWAETEGVGVPIWGLGSQRWFLGGEGE